MKKGCKFGTHRVIEPIGVLPQAAQKIDNTMEVYDNEILIDVIKLNIDSASFKQLKDEYGNDEEAIKKAIINIVSSKGKMQNPVTHSGGMLIGGVSAIGSALKDKIDLEVGDKIATLVSLSLTPLNIESIDKVHMGIDQVEITGKAILFESGLYSKLPNDMDESLALAVLDIAGAPAQTARMVKSGDYVIVLGAGGKSGTICCYEAKKKVGSEGKVIGVESSQSAKDKLKRLNLCDEIIVADARDCMSVYNKFIEVSGGKECDLAINCVNIPNTEMSTILPVKDGGTAYFFSMATSFTKATLGAEGVGKDINMIMGNGYAKGHAEIALAVMYDSKEIRELYENIYVD